ncbi:hypothetical protein QAD02_022896 [Eretmocerus hayati]|uniref:Uncharacterized protein n=1 Tax=Eretmocerus hayati TaxID=131215 RepID=A0ACC2PXN7_9HYME|nr:hypothetical protein QAD02_022896 [Eretmocerus hayati]
MTMPARITRRSSRLLSNSIISVNSKISNNKSNKIVLKNDQEQPNSKYKCEFVNGAKTDSVNNNVQVITVIAEVHVDACPDDYFDFADIEIEAANRVRSDAVDETSDEPMTVISENDTGDNCGHLVLEEHQPIGCTEIGDNSCTAEIQCNASEPTSNRYYILL